MTGKGSQSVSKLVDQIGSFTTVPNSVIKRWGEIGLDAMGLFLYLRYRTNGQTEVAFPSYDTIHAETGLSRNRIARAIRVLEKAELVERRKRFGQSTIYTLKCPPVQSSQFGTNDVSPETGLKESQGGTAIVPERATNKKVLNKKDINKKKPVGGVVERHPAIQAYFNAAKQWPAKGQVESIETVIGCEAAKVDLWQRVVAGYVLKGWNPRNIANMLEFFGRGEVPSANGQKPTNGHKPKMTPEEVSAANAALNPTRKGFGAAS